jgi:hypothetical protein
MVPNLNITTTEIDLIRQQISALKLVLLSVPAPSVRQTPIDEASGKDLANQGMAFSWTGQRMFGQLGLELMI